jgi:hypothetical protein
MEAWWQMPDKQEALAQNTKDTMLPLQALDNVNDILRGLAKPYCLWGNGADFDCVILRSLFKSYGARMNGDNYKNTRCLRTLAAMYPDTVAPRTYLPVHVALCDAMREAKHLAEIVKEAANNGQ